MCEQGNKIRFCTCDVRDLKVPYWRLFRPTNDYMKPMVVGIFLPPEDCSESENEEKLPALEASVRTALDSGKAFDFEYIPEDGDLFELHTEDSTIVFTAESYFMAFTEPDRYGHDLRWSYDYDEYWFEEDPRLQNLAQGSIEKVKS